MAQFTLKQLRYVEALAEQGHFGRAADVCSVSQPALSVQIKELEQNLGVALFERGNRQVQLTGFGQEFLIRAQTILRSVAELSELARAAQGQLAGRLRLGVIPTIAPYLLPTLLRKIPDHFPELDLHVRETLTPRLIEELSDGRIDVAIVALPISEPHLSEVAIFEEDMLLVRPKSQGDMPAPGRAELAQERLLLLEEGHCFRDQALSFCNINGAEGSRGLDGSSLATLVQMVGAGHGVTLIPEMAEAVETRSAAVSVTRFSDPAPQRMIGMIWRKSSPLGDQFKRLSDVVKDAGEAMRNRQQPGIRAL